MADFSVFDSILDIIFVIDSDGRIAYCNEVAATFTATSVRRVSGKVLLVDILKFDEPGLLPFTPESAGRHEPTPFIETAYEAVKASRRGKVQLAIRPMGDQKHWGVFIKDVSLEETLAAKYRAELAKTEEYARNLEKLVAARTAELNSVNQTLNAILNSLGQGFFTFNADGDCGTVFTRACEDVLEGVPKGRKVWDVLAIKGDEQSQFGKWSESLFKEYLPFEDLKGLGPAQFPHSAQKHIVLDYFPIRREQDGISDIVVVATDKTVEHRVQAELEAEKHYASMIVKFTKNKDQFLQFLASVRKSTANLLEMAQREMASANVAEAFRVLHTLEGEAGTFSMQDLRMASRGSQQLLEPFKDSEKMDAQAKEEFVKSLRDLQSGFEHFLHENKDIFRLSEGGDSRSVEVALKDVNVFFEDLKKNEVPRSVIRKFQEIFYTAPIEDRFKYFDGLVQTVAERLGKRARPILIQGGEVRIYPEPYAAMFSSMVHAFRNAVDHGLEMPDEREWAGKDPAGQIRVHVEKRDKNLQILISDDGKGIDPAVIRPKLLEKFPDRDFSTASDHDVIQAVCMPGFSSRDEVGEFSGRGVGLDALREEVLRLGGTLTLKSVVGQGTSIEITIPELELDPIVLRSA